MDSLNDNSAKLTLADIHTGPLEPLVCVTWVPVSVGKGTFPLLTLISTQSLKLSSTAKPASSQLQEPPQHKPQAK
jgi:hypothetical protein